MSAKAALPGARVVLWARGTSVLRTVPLPLGLENCALCRCLVLFDYVRLLPGLPAYEASDNQQYSKDT